MHSGEGSTGVRERVFRAVMLLVCSWILLAVTYRLGKEGEWYQFSKLMSFSEAPPYQHRILFVLLANLIKAVLPGLSDTGYFMLSQVPVVLLMFWVIERWARLHVGPRLSFVAQPLAALMLIPTIGYYTFYDFGVVLFFTACLLCLYQRRFLLYLALLGLATANHESILLIIPVSAALYWDRGLSRGRLVAFVAVQLAIVAGVRWILLATVPRDALWLVGRLPYNVELFTHKPMRLVRSFGLEAVAMWCVLAALGWRGAPEMLRRCLVLVPLVLLMTLKMGQFNESRMFDSLVPVILAFCLHAIRDRLGWPLPGEAARGPA